MTKLEKYLHLPPHTPHAMAVGGKLCTQLSGHGLGRGTGGLGAIQRLGARGIHAAVRAVRERLAPPPHKSQPMGWLLSHPLIIHMLRAPLQFRLAARTLGWRRG